MVKTMLEVVVNSLYPALTTVKMDWLFLCTPDSVMFATSRPLFPSPSSLPPLPFPFPPPSPPLPFSACRSLSHALRCQGNCWRHPASLPVLAPEASPPGAALDALGSSQGSICGSFLKITNLNIKTIKDVRGVLAL